jgi:protein-S-isoprenylcysteine O-methyltransferase Ste14
MKTRPLLLDAFERVLVLLAYGWLVARIVASYRASGDFANLLLLPSEGAVFVFVLLRRRTEDVSRRTGDWALALAATFAPMLVTPGVRHALIPPTAGALLLVTGILIQVHAKLVLGKSFGCVPANRGLKVAGPYRLVRHPMYSGYMLSHVAFALMNPTWWNLAMYLTCDALLVPRLLAEERLLSRDEAYRRYQSVVTYRLVPGVF